MGNVDPKIRVIKPVTTVTFSLEGVAKWTIYEAGATISKIDYVVDGSDRTSGLTVTDEFHEQPAGLVAEGIKITFSAGQPVILIQRYISG